MTKTKQETTGVGSAAGSDKQGSTGSEEFHKFFWKQYYQLLDIKTQLDFMNNFETQFNKRIPFKIKNLCLYRATRASFRQLIIEMDSFANMLLTQETSNILCNNIQYLQPKHFTEDDIRDPILIPVSPPPPSPEEDEWGKQRIKEDKQRDAKAYNELIQACVKKRFGDVTEITKEAMTALFKQEGKKILDVLGSTRNYCAHPFEKKNKIQDITFISNEQLRECLSKTQDLFRDINYIPSGEGTGKDVYLTTFSISETVTDTLNIIEFGSIQNYLHKHTPPAKNGVKP